MKFAERVSRLTPSVTLAITSKAKAMKKNGIDVVGFGAGEPDFDTPGHIKKAGIKAIESGFTKYTPASGTPELKAAICAKLKSDNSLIYKPEEIVASCGAKHALYNIFQVICDKGDEVIIISPYWLSYPEMVRLSGATPKFVESDERSGFAIDPVLIKKAITKKTKALILNSPSNPTGAVLSEATLYEIAKIAREKNIIIISDEIYEKLIYGGKEHVSIGSLGKDIFNLTLTVNGVSKTYSMTGWRIGYVAGPHAIIDKISALQSHSTSNPASISQNAALEALKGSQEGLSGIKKEFSSRRDYMTERVDTLGKMSCVKPDGAFYVFVNISKTGLGSVELCERLLEEAQVACVPGIAFGSDKHIRLSFAVNIDTIKKGMDRLENWIKTK